VIDPTVVAGRRPIYGPAVTHGHSGPYTYGMSRRSNNSSRSSLDSLQHPKSSLGSLHSLQKPSSSYVPLYENSEMTYSARQPAGRPVMPIRSVFTDVGYGSTQKITDKSDPNDKFSVRAEAGKAINTLKLSQKSQSQTQDSRLNPGVTRRVPPTGESDSPENTLLFSAGKRSSLATAETASIATNSSANTFIVKSDDVVQNPGMHIPGKAGNSNSNLTAEAVDLIEESLIGRSQPRVTDHVVHYHDSGRNSVGLGLAPPLSSLIMSSNIKVVQVDHHSDSEGSTSRTPSLQRVLISPTSPTSSSASTAMAEESFNAIDNLSVIEKAHEKIAAKAKATPLSPVAKRLPPPRRRPPVPPKPSEQPSWPPSLSHPGGVIPRTRDEGDGRSMTDSQYSGYSPNGQQPPMLPKQPQPQSGLADLSAKMNFLKLNGLQTASEVVNCDLSVTEEGSEVDKAGDSNSSVISVGGRLKPRDIADYINQELRSPKAEHRKNALSEPLPTSKKNPSLPADTVHPHRVWSRTANGGLKYTGMLSSDC